MAVTAQAVPKPTERADLNDDPWATRILQRYPITCILIAPYLFLILPQAVYYDNPKTGFIVYVVALAAGGSAAVETLFLLLRPPYRKVGDAAAANSRWPRIMRVVRVVAVISVTADVTNAAFGGGTIVTQMTGRAASSPIVALTTPLAGWRYLAVALLASAYLGGYATKKQLCRWVLVVLAGQVAVASFTTITQPVANFISFLALGGILLGLVRVRLVLFIGIILLSAWPVIFALRNDARSDNGVRVSTSVSATDRLRFDQQMSQASSYSVPANLPGAPGAIEVIRYGLVPRALDPGRPTLSTGMLINDYIGGTRTSSYNFLAVGTVYFIDGPYGVLLFCAAWALAFMLLLRTGGGPGPLRIAVMAFAIIGPLGWTSTYPDSMIGLLQALPSTLPVVAALAYFGRAERPAVAKVTRTAGTEYSTAG